jgi:hypothetical protein
LGWEGFVRKFLFGAAISLLVGGVAYAEDFIVVGSTDPSIAKSATYSSGDRVVLAKGATVTLINGAGALTRITSRPGGVVLPGSASSTPEPRFAALRALVERPQARRTFGAMRGRDTDESCPKPADLTTIDQILAADAADCTGAAQEAMATYMAAAAK